MIINNSIRDRLYTDKVEDKTRLKLFRIHNI